MPRIAADSLRKPYNVAISCVNAKHKTTSENMQKIYDLLT